MNIRHFCDSLYAIALYCRHTRVASGACGKLANIFKVMTSSIRGGCRFSLFLEASFQLQQNTLGQRPGFWTDPSFLPWLLFFVELHICPKKVASPARSGETPVIVATIAFGMGVNKRDVWGPSGIGGKSKGDAKKV